MQEVPLNIERKPLELFGITMNQKLSPDIQMLTGCNVQFMTKHDTAENDNERNVFVQYDYDINSVSDDFKFQARIVREFKLSPFNKITPRGIYQCAVICQNEIQEYVNKIFSEYAAKPQVPIKPYEDLETYILQLIEDFYK